MTKDRREKHKTHTPESSLAFFFFFLWGRGAGGKNAGSGRGSQGLDHITINENIIMFSGDWL